MYKPVISKSSPSSGYTLIEMSITIIIIGVLLAPAFSLYSLYQKNQKLKQTDRVSVAVTNAVGGFSSLYGRYPCPAPLNAVPGDDDYGHEYRNPVTGACLTGADKVVVATSNNTGLTDKNIYIGALPFRQLNAQENEAYDAYNNRVLYAVTGVLTDDDTFNPTDGGISVIDSNTDSLVSPEHSAHFIVLLPNRLNDGAYSRDGVKIGTCAQAQMCGASPCPSTGTEVENCDFDETFVYRQKSNDFDDSLIYSTNISQEQWQIAENNLQNIHLRNTIGVAIGADETDNLSDANTLEVINTGTDDGTITVTSDGSNFSGTFRSDVVCNEDGSECFSPNLIAGKNADGEGMICPSGQYMVGIENNTPICRDEVYFSCPIGKIIGGIDSNGNLICNTLPPGSCEPMVVPPTCGGDDRTLAATQDGNFSSVFSGTCYRLNTLDTTVVKSKSTIDEIKAYINGLNNGARTETDCGPDANTGMIRDTYVCKDSTWQTPPVSQERGYSWPTDALSTSAPYPPEVSSTQNFDPAAPMSVDPGNTSASHDCWCREDYRVYTTSCPNNGAGDYLLIQKLKCPQTSSSWSTVYSDSTTFCSCQEGVTPKYQYCYSYFSAPSDSMSGVVKKNYQVTCPDGPSGSPSVSSTPSSIDTSGCSCPSRGSAYATTSCPQGTTNSFTYDGTTYTGVSELRKNEWVCPNGSSVNSSSDAGYWTGYKVVKTASCSCDNTLVSYVEESCPAGLGGSVTYKRQWDCSKGTWEDRSGWEKVKEDCYSCTWSTPGGTPPLSDYPTKNPVGGSCACGSTDRCHESSGGLYKVWNGCSCTPD